MDYIRTIVSGKKNRYIDDKYNLDLTYITPRIIAMAFPASGLKTIYRNKIADVSQFLNEKHPERFMIINLSGEKYDAKLFNNTVINFDQWKDHHAPPLELLFVLVEKIHGFLSNDSDNIVVVNCNAGKGRTGTLICCYLLFSGKFKEVKDAFDYYSLKRFSEGNGLTHASQKRYVEYFYKILNAKYYPIPAIRILKKIEISCSAFDKFNSIICDFVIYNKNNEIIYTNEKNRKEVKCSRNSPIVFTDENFKVALHGDILIELYNHRKVKTKKSFGRISFNTAFIDRTKNIFEFPLSEIDPYEFSINPKVNKNYLIRLEFENSCDKDSDICTHITDLCEDCQRQLENEIKDYQMTNKIKQLYSKNNKKAHRLLFGHYADDIDKTLSKRSRLQSKIEANKENDKKDNCIIY